MTESENIAGYFLADYYAPSLDGNYIRQPLCWSKMGKNHEVCSRSCVYCPHSKDGSVWYISAVDSDGKPNQCRYKTHTTSPKFCMPECDKNYKAGRCADGKTTVCPLMYKDCKNPGYLEDQDISGDPPQLCDLNCCDPDFSNACSSCFVKGSSKYDFPICKKADIIKKLPTRPQHPNCGNYISLSLTWLQY